MFAPRVTGPFAPTMRGEVLARMAEQFVGCSLSHRRRELAGLVAGGDDNPDRIVEVKTNCGMFARGVFEACGVWHDVLDKPYVNGRAIADVRRVAMQQSALDPFVGQALERGTLLHYWTRGKNDNHVEFLLSDVNEGAWVAPTCGGGRPDNAITRTPPYDVRTRFGKPLYEVIDPQALLADTFSFGVDVSVHNGGAQSIDFAHAHAWHRIEWGKVRITEGLSPDPAAEGYVRAMREANMVPGGYHRFIPWHSAQAQVDAYSTAADKLFRPGDLAPDLDVESWRQDDKTLSRGERARRRAHPAWAPVIVECLTLLEKRYGAAVRYHNVADFRLMGSPASFDAWPLWLADYTGDPDLAHWRLWQRIPRILRGVSSRELDWSVARRWVVQQ